MTKTGIDLKQVLCELAAAPAQENGYSASYLIPGNTIDPSLTGKWVSADGNESYLFQDSGIVEYRDEDLGSASTYTWRTVTAGGKTLLAIDRPAFAYNADGRMGPTTELTWYSFRVTENMLCLLDVQRQEPVSGMRFHELAVYYRYENGRSLQETMQNEPVSLRSWYGEWTHGSGTISIGPEGMVTPQGTYALSRDEFNRLVLSRDGCTQAYTVRLSVHYGRMAQSPFEKYAVRLSISYTGSGSADIPWLSGFTGEGWFLPGNRRAYSASFLLTKE